MSKSLLIVAGESSGELYGSLLAAEIKKAHPDVRLFGAGGERMREQGVEIVREISGAFGLTELLAHLKDLKQTFRELIGKTAEMRPQAAVLIDFPDFNFKVAGELKKMGIPVLYYVSPQLWAWRAGRIKKIKRLVDFMALILPFEEEIYRGAGIPHEFVGHPAFDEISLMQDELPDIFLSGLGFDSKRPLLAMLPGSRPSELKKHLPVFIELLGLFKREFPAWQFFVPLAPNLKTEQFKEDFKALREMGAVINKKSALKVLLASDAAVIASGTATLQGALLEKPFTVIYKVSPVTFYIAKALVKVKYASLVNILSGGQCVKEYLQKDAKPDKIMAELREIIKNPDYRKDMLSRFKEIRAVFEGKSASKRVSEIVCRIAGWG